MAYYIFYRTHFLPKSVNLLTKFSVVCTLIDNDIRHHSSQIVVDSRGLSHHSTPKNTVSFISERDQDFLNANIKINDLFDPTVFGLKAIFSYIVNWSKFLRKRSDLEKHSTIKNCDRTFLKNILRSKKLKS